MVLRNICRSCKKAQNNRFSQKLKHARKNAIFKNTICNLHQKSESDDKTAKHNKLLEKKGE